MTVKNRLFFVLGIISLISLVVVLAIDLFLSKGNSEGVGFKGAEVLLSVSTSFTVSISVGLKINKNKISSDDNNNDSGSQLNNSSDAHLEVNNGSNIFNIGYSLNEFMDYYSNTIIPQQKKNMEEIAKKTIDELLNNPSNIELDKDFVMKYIEDSRYISDQDIQDIWVKLLMHSVKKEKGASKRTLDIIKNMSSDEAKTFESIACLSFVGGAIPKDYQGIEWLSISLLQDIGLLKSGDFINLTISIMTEKVIVCQNSRLVLLAENKGTKEAELKLECNVLTSEGIELRDALGLCIPDDKMIELGQQLKNKYLSKNIVISVNNVLSRNNDSITFSNQDLLT